MILRSYFVLVISFVLPVLPGLLVADEALSLKEAVTQALAQNPGLAASSARAEAMATMPDQAGALPDPRLRFGAMNVPTDTYELDQEPMTQLQVGISQAIPFPGKLGLKETAARHMSSSADNDVLENRQQLIARVKTMWWQLHYLDRALETTTRNKKLFRQFIQIARTKYKVGKGLQQDVLLAQLELSKLTDREIQLRQKRKAANSRLNALLNRSADRVIQITLVSDIILTAIPDVIELTELARKNRPLLLSQRNRIEGAQARLDLANMGYYPNFMLGATYGKRSFIMANGNEASDFASVMISMSLPLYGHRKQSQAITQRSAELVKQKHTLQNRFENVTADLSRYSADFESASQRVLLFKSGIIPQARQTVASMLAGYQVNKVDFLNLVRAQITLYNYETQYWKAASEAFQARARLAATAGKENFYE